jgi:hypothetical protein
LSPSDRGKIIIKSAWLLSGFAQATLSHPVWQVQFFPDYRKRMADNRNNRDRSNSSMGLVVFAGPKVPQKQPTA